MPTAEQFFSTNRGGGLFSETISQRIGSYLALAAFRLGLAPTTLTLINLVLGVGTSVALVVVGVPSWPVALVAFLLWQLAYAFDCADGQLARVAGQTSPAGGRVDILCDVAIQISLVTAISSVAVAARSDLTPAWLIALFAGTWLVNLVTAVLSTGQTAASLLTSRSLLVRAVKLVRDYGAMLTACGLVLMLAPAWTPWLMAGFCVTNGGFLTLSIMQAAVAAFRSSGKLAGRAPERGRSANEHGGNS
jgi:phosphatidylglycerophosphate synthase